MLSGIIVCPIWYNFDNLLLLLTQILPFFGSLQSHGEYSRSTRDVTSDLMEEHTAAVIDHEEEMVTVREQSITCPWSSEIVVMIYAILNP